MNGRGQGLFVCCLHPGRSFTQLLFWIPQKVVGTGHTAYSWTRPNCNNRLRDFGLDYVTLTTQSPTDWLRPHTYKYFNFQMNVIGLVVSVGAKHRAFVWWWRIGQYFLDIPSQPAARTSSRTECVPFAFDGKEYIQPTRTYPPSLVTQI